MVSSTERADEEKLVLLAASNLMRGALHISCDQERLSTMQLLLRAATLAVLKASVNNTRKFLEFAIGLIQVPDWSLNYELCINLHNLYTEANSCTGCFEKSDAAIAIVLE
jgi:hypothetical protein